MLPLMLMQETNGYGDISLLSIPNYQSQGVPVEPISLVKF